MKQAERLAELERRAADLRWRMKAADDAAYRARFIDAPCAKEDHAPNGGVLDPGGERPNTWRFIDTILTLCSDASMSYTLYECLMCGKILEYSYTGKFRRAWTPAAAAKQFGADSL